MKAKHGTEKERAQTYQIIPHAVSCYCNSVLRTQYNIMHKQLVVVREFIAIHEFYALNSPVLALHRLPCAGYNNK